MIVLYYHNYPQKVFISRMKKFTLKKKKKVDVKTETVPSILHQTHPVLFPSSCIRLAPLVSLRRAGSWEAFLHLLIHVNTQLLSEMQPKFNFSPIMQVFSDGYICITHANGIPRWRECIAYIFRMGGLSGTLNHYFY